MLTTIGTWLGHEVFDVALSDAVRKVLSRRADVAKQLLLEELERGTVQIEEVADKDEAAAMVFEYARAAQHGAARRNLRMLAQVLVSGLQAPPIYADEFLRWSRILADLSREEIILAATLHSHYEGVPSRVNPKAFAGAQTELVGTGLVFSTEEEMQACATSLTRTGLVVMNSVLGGDAPAPTSRLNALMAIIRIADILADGER
jgi:hypothetical protein